MKLLFSLFLLTLVLSSCGAEEPKHVDVEAEFLARPAVTLSLEDDTTIMGFEGDYCTASVCLNKEPIDFSALTFTPIENGGALYLYVSGDYEIESINASLVKKDGSEFYRDLEFTPGFKEREYTLEQNFETTETQVTLHVLVDFLEHGRSNFYYPIEL